MICQLDIYLNHLIILSMPTYEYRCQKCGYVFERLQSISAKPLRRCPRCEGPVERLIGSGAGLIFKGNGFYETDYKRKSQSSAKPEKVKSEKDR